MWSNEKCLCPNEKCKNHSKCEECIKSHVGKKVPVHCIKETTKRQ